MSKRSAFPPDPPKRQQKGPLTPEQVAKAGTDRRRRPPGQPDMAVVTLRLVLPCSLVKQLGARAIREGVRLEAVVEEILEGVPE